jgi:hypothetical protein
MNSHLLSSETVLEQIAGIVSGCDCDPRRDMHFIDPKTAHNWTTLQQTGDYWTVLAIDSTCPHCHRAVTINLDAPVLIPQTESIAMRGRCPRCQDDKPIRVFLTEVRHKHETTRECGGIWMEPVPKIRSLMISQLPEKRVFNGYKDAVESFNAGMWSSSITSCGRVVEGIGKTKFPNAQATKQIKGLFDKLRSELKKAPDFKELLEPLLNLGEALRIGRNPGTHFDLETEPDRNLADKVIDLTEFLIRYIYLISDETTEVNRLILELGPGDADEDEILDKANSTT